MRQSPYHHVASTLEIRDGVTQERKASIGETCNPAVNPARITERKRIKSGRELIQGLGSSLQRVLLYGWAGEHEL